MVEQDNVRGFVQVSETGGLALISALGSDMSFVVGAVLLEVDTSLALAHGAYAWARRANAA